MQDRMNHLNHHQRYTQRDGIARQSRMRRYGDRWDVFGMLLLMALVLMIVRVQAAQAQAPTATSDPRLPITIFVETRSNEPLAGMTMTMYAGDATERVVATATTDEQGYADLLLRPGSYTAVLDGTLPDGTALHPGGPYRTIGGMPISISPDSSLVCYEVGEGGGTTPVICPLRFGLESSGSQEALTVTPAFGTPVPRLVTATTEPTASPTPLLTVIGSDVAGGTAPQFPVLADPVPVTAPVESAPAGVPWGMLLLLVAIAGAGLLTGYLLWGRPRTLRGEG